jgi:ATP-dependent DNA helicase RecG
LPPVWDTLLCIVMTDQELEQLATDLESDRVERKESLSGSAKEKVGQAICAFANDLPGHGKPGIVFVGLDDKGAPTGIRVTDELLRDLAGYRSDGNILPLPNLTVEKRLLLGREVAVVTVWPCPDPPVRFYGQVWIRVGPRRALASRDEERALTERRRSADLHFDQRPVSHATLDDLDLEFFEKSYLPAAVSPEVLEENRRSLRDRLAALHLLAPNGFPNYASLLLLGRDPRRWMPGAYVQFVRLDGTELTAPILDHKELEGTLPKLIQRMDDLARVNIRIAAEVGEHTVEKRRPDYPLAALQQLLRNALLHRTYEVNAPVQWYWFSDRIEINSPGGLYGRVTEVNFGQPYATDYRNPTLAEGLKVLGFVQRFGLGVLLARERCRDNGNPEPSFEFSSSSVLVVVRSAR